MSPNKFKERILKEKKFVDDLWDGYMERIRYGEINQEELQLMMAKCNKIDQQLINNEMQKHL